MPKPIVGNGHHGLTRPPRSRAKGPLSHVRDIISCVSIVSNRRFLFFRLAIDCNRWNADEPELDRVPDHYPRFLVLMDPVDLSRDGIRHLNICDFLEEE